MGKIYVKYVGETNILLENGKIYRVKSKGLIQKRMPTITLVGIPGKFAATQFIRVTAKPAAEQVSTQPANPQVKRLYLAISKTLPRKGERLPVKIIINEQTSRFAQTGHIHNLNQIGSNVYQIETKNSVYIVQIV